MMLIVYLVISNYKLEILLMIFKFIFEIDFNFFIYSYLFELTFYSIFFVL